MNTASPSPRLMAGLSCVLAGALLTLGACSSSNGGGGGGGGATAAPAPQATTPAPAPAPAPVAMPDDFQSNFDRVTALGPTGNMPDTLTATYTGVASMDLHDANQGGGKVGSVLADLELLLNFTDGQANNPWSGKADNFRGDINGTDFAGIGTLTVANAEGKSLPSTFARNVNTINAPIVGPVTTATGAAMVNLSGELDVNGEKGDILMALGGQAFGDQAKAVAGTASTQWFGPQSGFGPVTGAGNFYVERH